jgi:DNA mismatch repair protein MSH3
MFIEHDLTKLRKSLCTPTRSNLSIQVSSTQKLSRFIPPAVQTLIDTLAIRREELNLAAAASLQSLCEGIANKHQRALESVSRASAHLDALFSLATVATQPGYVKPHIDSNDRPSGGCWLDAEVARHPVLEKLSLAESSVYVPNDIQLGYRGDDDDSDSIEKMENELTRVMLITGSCAGGKVRPCAGWCRVLFGC